MTTPLSVSALTEQIKNLLETTFVRVNVEGELSRITYHNSGHIYFTLKDSGASISCVMFRGNASKLRFRLEEGLKVFLDGALTLYKPRGQYQLNTFMIEPAGHGALALAYEQLKQRLSDKGYFDPQRKRALPKIPRCIALVTSATGAALQDMLRVASHRWPLVRLDVFDTVVQGENAAPSIVRAIRSADQKRYEVIVIARGGGSIEDLWAFNEESVADAIYHADTPVVSAVGHEIDWLISDFVADLRAPTPSAAMQMLLPDQHEMLQNIDALMSHYDTSITQRLHRSSDQLIHLQNSFARHSIEQRLVDKKKEILQLQERFTQSVRSQVDHASRKVSPLFDEYSRTMQSLLNTKKSAFLTAQRLFEANHPRLKSKRGFAQISVDGKVIDLSMLDVGDDFDAMDTTWRVRANVIERTPVKGS